MENNYFELYANGKTVIPIKNKEKIAILKLLKEGNKSFSELVKILKKPKSTVSTLLDSLQKNELLNKYTDKRDSRKRFYKMTSFVIASTQNVRTEKENIEFAGSLDDPFEFMNALFRSLQSMLNSFGMDTEPMTKIMGEKVGHELSKKITGQTPHEIIVEINNFFTKHRLGKTIIVTEEPFVFLIADCIGCTKEKSIAKTLCSFNEGVVKAVVEEKLGKNIIVQAGKEGKSASCKYVVIG